MSGFMEYVGYSYPFIHYLLWSTFIGLCLSLSLSLSPSLLFLIPESTVIDLLTLRIRLIQLPLSSYLLSL